MALEDVGCQEVDLISAERRVQLKRNIPDIYNYQSMAYVGARNRGFLFGQEFFDAGYKITVIEAFDKNVNYLKSIDIVDRVVHLDILKLAASKVIDEQFDVVMWIHGPEHVVTDDFIKVLPSLEKITRKHLILMCPWGRYEQDAIYGNPYEVHKEAYYPEFFSKLGFSFETLGQKDVEGSNLMSWKSKERE